VQSQNESYRNAAIERLRSEVPQDECAVAPSQESLKTDEWRLGFDVDATSQNLETRVHAVERVPSEGRAKPAQFILTRFVFTNKLGKDEKLLLAFDAFVLSEILGRGIGLGKIIRGVDHSTLKVQTSACPPQNSCGRPGSFLDKLLAEDWHKVNYANHEARSQSFGRAPCLRDAGRPRLAHADFLEVRWHIYAKAWKWDI
jgi:hypothetical protein